MEQKYAQLPTNSRPLDEPDVDHATTPPWSTRPRLHYLVTFMLGLLCGVIATSALERIFPSTGTAAARVPIRSQADEATQDSDLDPYRGQLTCGTDSHEAEAAGCHFDIMASSWYSEECFNREVLDQMLDEVSFNWVCGNTEVLVLRVETPADILAVCC